MKRLFVKLQTDPNAKPVIMELPGEIPVNEVIPNLVRGEGWDETEGEEIIKYWFETEVGPIAMNKSLTQSGIKNGTVLYMRRSTGRSVDEVIASDLNDVPQNISPKDMRSPLPSPLRGSLKGDAQLLGGSTLQSDGLNPNTGSSTLKGSFLKK